MSPEVEAEAEYYGINPKIWAVAILEYPDLDRGELAQELARLENQS